MALITLPGLVELPKAFSMAAYGSAVVTSGKKFANVFRAPKTGNIVGVSLMTGTVTTGDPTVDTRLETVDTNGNPSGTLWGTNTNGNRNIADADDNLFFEVTLTAAAAVTQGDLIAVVMVPASGTVNLIMNRPNPLPAGFGVPFSDLDAGGGTWTKTGSGCIGAVHYDDGTYPYVHGLMPFSSLTVTTIASNTTPDEIGNKIVAPATLEAIGAWFSCNTGNTTADLTVKLYDSSDNVLTSITVDMNQQGNIDPFFVRFPVAVTLTKDATYRLTILPTTTNVLGTRRAAWPSGKASATPFGSVFSLTQRTDAGAWTDTADNAYFMGLLVSKIHDGGAVAYSYAS